MNQTELTKTFMIISYCKNRLIMLTLTLEDYSHFPIIFVWICEDVTQFAQIAIIFDKIKTNYLTCPIIL